MDAKTVVAGSLRSKTQWLGAIVMVLGILQDQGQLLTQLIGPDHMGKVMAAIGLAFMVLRALTTSSLEDKVPEKTEGGFVRVQVLIVLALLSIGFALGGCGLMQAASQPVHGEKAVTTEAPALRAARVAIDEANASLVGLNTVIGQNVESGVWTKAQGQGYLDESRAAGRRLDGAREALRGGLLLDAKSQAEAVRLLVLTLHKRVAAEARKEK